MGRQRKTEMRVDQDKIPQLLNRTFQKVFGEAALPETRRSSLCRTHARLSVGDLFSH